MPAAFPLPSKGALRALRHLAFGTSCTAAFALGVLVDDRRRLIHTLREIRSNGQRIKSSDRYNPKRGKAIVRALEERILKQQDDDFWRPAHRLQLTDNISDDRATPNISANAELNPRKSPITSPAITRYNYLRSHTQAHKNNRNLSDKQPPPDVWSRRRIRRTWLSAPQTTARQWIAWKVSRQEFKLHELKCQAIYRQEKLANDTMKLLEEDKPNIDLAVARFINVIEETRHIVLSGISILLQSAAQKLAEACRMNCKFDLLQRVFSLICSVGPIQEDFFLSFEPVSIIRRLISRPPGNKQSLLDLEKLKKAVSIYTTEFLEQPKLASSEMLSLGYQLCQETCDHELYSFTASVFFRLKSSSCEFPARAVKYLLLASHNTNKIFHYFATYYKQITPEQSNHSEMTEFVVNALLSLGHHNEAEEVLRIAVDMAQKHDLSIHFKSLFNVLSEDWRVFQDIERTKALFERLEPLSNATAHSTRLYAAIIYTCIVACDYAAARSIHERLKKHPKFGPSDVIVDDYFILAKAQLGDWPGVEGSLREMTRRNGVKFRNILAPILKIFYGCHSASETESFLKTAFEIGIDLTPLSITKIADIYAQEGDINSIARLLGFALQNGYHISPMMVNSVLHACREEGHSTFESVFALFNLLQKLESPSPLVNSETFCILRQVAISGSKTQARKRWEANIIRVNEAERPYRHLARKNPLDPKLILHEMESTFSLGDPETTLKIYEWATSRQVGLQSQHLNLAVRASLRCNGDNTKECAHMIQAAGLRGCDISLACGTLYIHQLEQRWEQGLITKDSLIDSIMGFVATFEAKGLAVPIPPLNHAMYFLSKLGKFREAINFWDSISTRLAIEPSSLSLVTLTVLLKSFIALGDIPGVLRVMHQVENNRLVPDQRFSDEIRNARDRIGLHLGPRTENNARSYDLLQTLIDSNVVANRLHRNALYAAYNARVAVLEHLGLPIPLPKRPRLEPKRMLVVDGVLQVITPKHAKFHESGFDELNEDKRDLDERDLDERGLKENDSHRTDFTETTFKTKCDMRETLPIDTRLNEVMMSPFR